MNKGKETKLLVALAIFLLLTLWLNYTLRTFFAGTPMNNEKDFLQHTGVTMLPSNQVPNGQTVSFSTNPDVYHMADFVCFLQLLAEYNITAIYDKPQRYSFWLQDCSSEALYFIREGIIYVYR